MIAQRDRGQPVGPVEADGMRFLSPTLDEALAYWHAIRGEAQFPRREALVPEEIVALWPYILMVDVMEGGSDYYFRLFGQRLVGSYGEQTGRTLMTAKVPSLVRNRCKQLFDRCLAHATPTYAYWPESASERRPFVDIEALCLPLSGDGTTLDRMISLNVNSRRSP
ncbi:MAG: PAS domain-containing protein [Kiloniellaceae bacterium]